MKQANKVVFIYLIALIFSGTLYASEITDLKNKINQCADVSENHKRLACYDSLTQLPQSKTLILNDTLPVNVKAVTQPEKVVVQSDIEEAFSKPQFKKVSEEVNSISLTIKSLTKMLRGQWKIIFSNGQIWQQKDFSELSLKEGQVVEIIKGALGSYLLKKPKSNKRIKVKRLK